jgi:hypothetical protein
MFPADGHPEMCAAVLDLTGDPRDEIVLWDRDRVWIYTQNQSFDHWASRTKARTNGKVYAPIRHPHYNDSNYRISESLPAWQELVTAPAANE